MTTKVTGFRHVGIIVKSMDKSLNFYRDILGLEVIQDSTDDSEYINTITGVKVGSVHFIKLKMPDKTVIELLEYPSYPTNSHNVSFLNVGICHFAIQVDSAKHMHDKLVNNGIEVISEPVLSSEGIAIVFFCLDPDGVRVELVQIIK
jgi:catechol 2,3-dioxygenase-like lactoylglutathione lyase family enzyme